MYFNPAMSEFNSNILKLMSDILAHMLICTAIDDGAKLDDSIETIFKNLMKHYNGYKMVLNKDISPERNVYYCNTDISGLFLQWTIVNQYFHLLSNSITKLNQLWIYSVDY